LVGVLIERLLDEALTEFPGLAQVLTGGPELGVRVATAEGIDFVVFTGSAPAGRALQAALEPLRRPALLQLGGANALLVCDDANLERAANATVFGRFSNNGQGCASITRVYVLRSVADAYIHKVVRKVRALKSGPYTNAYCEVGPLAHGRGLENLRAVLQDALDKRAQAATGGFPDHVTGRNYGERRGAERQGWYWPPVVLTEVDPTMRVLREPIFGPILPIRVVEDDSAAIALANSTGYGFDACVFSRDAEHARQIATQLRAGSVVVNDVLIKAEPVASTDSAQQARGDSEPHWFPYSAAKLQALERVLMESAQIKGTPGERAY
jgi:succinate-semialdehyde dehydrogenase/glutarate-semialdehyde dehydrogenase